MPVWTAFGMPRIKPRGSGADSLCFSSVFLERPAHALVVLPVQVSLKIVVFTLGLHNFIVGLLFCLVLFAAAMTSGMSQLTAFACEIWHSVLLSCLKVPARAMARNPGGMGCRSFPAVSEVRR